MEFEGKKEEHVQRLQSMKSHGIFPGNIIRSTSYREVEDKKGHIKQCWVVKNHISHTKQCGICKYLLFLFVQHPNVLLN